MLFWACKWGADRAMGLGAQRSGRAREPKGAVEDKEQGPGVSLSFVRSETPVTWSNVCPQTCLVMSDSGQN